MSVKLLTVHNLEFLSFKVGCTGLSESTFVKIPHCWKSRVPGVATSLIIWLSLSFTFELSLLCILLLQTFSQGYMGFPIMWHFDINRLRRARAAAF